MSGGDGAGDLTPECRRALADWLLCVSDCKRLLGLRYAEWCTGAPELEADIAASAMAQYELGHARLLDGVLDGLDEDPRDEARDTDPSTWRSLPILDRPLAGWPELVAVNALVDTLLTVQLEAAADGGYRPLAQRLRKAVQEERYHLIHARAWCARLADAPRRIAGRFRDAAGAIWPQCIAWSGPSGGPGGDELDLLAGQDVLDAGRDALVERYVGRVAPMFEVLGGLPVSRQDGGWKVTEEVDFDGWNAASRRHGAPAFGDGCFAMISGAETRALGVRD